MRQTIGALFAMAMMSTVGMLVLIWLCLHISDQRDRAISVAEQWKVRATECERLCPEELPTPAPIGPVDEEMQE